jgi:pseudaminic acid cytidylyltransferase
MMIAIIVARGGSKRIPGKNIKNFFGKPIISYAINATLESGLFDKVIVSTDSEEIADVSRTYGAEIPFIRPAELADDYIPILDVFHHAIQHYKNQSHDMKYFCGILPTAPFLRAEDLKRGFTIIKKHQVSSAFSVTTYGYPILRSLKVNDNGNLEMNWPEHEMTRSNDLEEVYHDAGQFYWLNCDSYLKSKRIYTEDSMPVILPRYLVQDIDTLEDWESAEIMYQTLLNKNKEKES